MEGNGVKTHIWRSNIVMLIKFDVQSKNTTCVKDNNKDIVQH